MTAEESAMTLSISVHSVRRELRLHRHGCARRWQDERPGGVAHQLADLENSARYLAEHDIDDKLRKRMLLALILTTAYLLRDIGFAADRTLSQLDAMAPLRAIPVGQRHRTRRLGVVYLAERVDGEGACGGKFLQPGLQDTQREHFPGKVLAGLTH
jgi:hypothetical protein